MKLARWSCKLCGKTEEQPAVALSITHHCPQLGRWALLEKEEDRPADAGTRPGRPSRRI